MSFTFYRGKHQTWRENMIYQSHLPTSYRAEIRISSFLPPSWWVLGRINNPLKKNKVGVRSLLHSAQPVCLAVERAGPAHTERVSGAHTGEF